MKNLRWEKFQKNLLQGMSKKDAYIKAGYKCQGPAAKSAASRMYANVNFQRIYGNKLNKIAESAGITKARVLKEELRLAASDATKLFDGWTSIPPKDLPDELKPAISGIEYKETTHGKTIIREYKYKLWNKGHALDRISKLLGYYEPKKKKVIGDGDNPIKIDMSSIPDSILTPLAEKLIEAMDEY